MNYKPLYALFCLFFTVLLSSNLCAENTNLDWSEFEPGIKRSRVKVASNTFFTSELTLFKASLSNYRIGTIRAQEFGKRRSDVRFLCRSARAALCINANYFDEHGLPLGLVISRGRIHNKVHRGGGTLTGLLYSLRSGIHISHRDNLKNSSILEAIQAGPRLIVNSKPVTNLKDTSPERRSGVCLDAEKNIIFYIVSSGLRGVTLDALQQTLTQKSIACTDALNLDGGGSSQLYAQRLTESKASSDSSLYISGNDEVPIAIGLFPK